MGEKQHAIVHFAAVFFKFSHVGPLRSDFNFNSQSLIIEFQQQTSLLTMRSNLDAMHVHFPTIEKKNNYRTSDLNIESCKYKLLNQKITMKTFKKWMKIKIMNVDK